MRSPSSSLLDLDHGAAPRRLLAAIVRRAVLDFALYRDVKPKKDPLRHRLAVDAAGWLFFDGIEPRDEAGRYSFLHICLLLNLDAKAIREQALTLTREDIRRFNGDAGPG